MSKKNTRFRNEIAKLKHVTEELRSAINARDAFLGVASHELKTPLASLKLQSHLAKRTLQKQGIGAFGIQRLEKLIDNSNSQLDRLTRLVDDMLDVSRISSGKLVMSLAKTDVSSLVRDTVSRFFSQFDSAGCSVEQNIEDQITIDLDAFRFEQVLVNLISNVTKYAPGKPVKIALNKNSSRVTLKFRDHGPGIPKDKFLTIFERFERLVNANEISGLGLGLNISQEIIKAHGGKIYVESELGCGSEFIVTLPLSRDERS